MTPWQRNYRRQFHRSPERSLVAHRYRSERVASMLAGWPSECTLAQRKCLEAVESGCQTAREVAERLGRPWYPKRGDSPVRKRLNDLASRGWLSVDRGKPTRYSLSAEVAEGRAVFHGRERDDLT